MDVQLGSRTRGAAEHIAASCENEFYLPGERATDVNGNKWVCGPDGQWFRDYSALLVVNPTVKFPIVKAVSLVVSAKAVLAH